jgi:nucleoside-diphosphate-sugar epimerase
MRVVIVGASGNVGSAVIRALSAEPRVTSVVGLARRHPDWALPKTEWVSADIAVDDLVPLVRGADVVVHLAWQFQPTHDPYLTWTTNAVGTARVLDAVSEAEVPALVYASSVGAYSPRDDDTPVDEDWPTHGWPTAAYGREKAYTERLLDTFVHAHPERRVVRFRPAFIFQESSAMQQRRLFAGALLPTQIGHRGLVPVLPWPQGLRFQALHADDAADAYRLAVIESVAGAFNLAADPVITGERMAELLDARLVPVPSQLVRRSIGSAWHARLLPASPDLFEMAMRLPVMSAARATNELAWSPRHGADDAIREFLEGLRHRASGPTPPLAA